MFSDLPYRKSIIGLGILTVVAIIGLSLLYVHFDTERTTASLTVKLDGIASAELIDSVTDKPLRSVGDGDTISLSYGSDHIIRYKGATGFTDGESLPIDPYQSEIKLVANYSPERLAKTYRQEASAINQAIKAYAPNLTKLYDITPGDLFIRGDWYGTILRYKGDALVNRDNVAIVLHKQDGKWQVVTDPPLPSVTLREDAKLQVPLEVREAVTKKIIDQTSYQPI